ncbi:hypothetical protein HPB51_024892 [Rhipicephalus microplus]|uniref:SWIM-type domain-containing protein n=1 Tax=Rhipicephalus microplus TaxID=6941 RepID=A0A9J6EPK3_RHIMP|nr:hypothetical protein HPB51_024892 [Rhipicephalus microplus]
MNDTVADFINQAPTSSKQQTKSCAFAVEGYTLPLSVVTNACDTSLGIVYARATCYRSQKKSGRPYKVCLALKTDSGAVADSTCERPAGSGGACSHILAARRVLLLLKQKGFKEAPLELSCTELPQKWRHSRRQGIRPMARQNMNWRSPREGGMDMSMSPLFACIKHPRSAYTDHKASSPGEVTLLDWLERVFSTLSIPHSKLHRPLIASSAAFLNDTFIIKHRFIKTRVRARVTVWIVGASPPPHSKRCQRLWRERTADDVTPSLTAHPSHFPTCTKPESGSHFPSQAECCPKSPVTQRCCGELRGDRRQ